MPVTLTWIDVVVRLLLTALAGGVVGLNRGEKGRAAGLRTTMLVCLAASASMIQANWLLATVGKSHDSFVTLDLMRLPLGILSGMGFIGGGAILRRGNMVRGVTTAATLWYVTVMGLCFGGGQLSLGLALLALGMFVLTALHWLERRLVQTHRAVLTLSTTGDGPGEAEIRDLFQSAGMRVASWSVAYAVGRQRRVLRCEVRWKARLLDPSPPAMLHSLSERPGVVKLQWKALVAG